MIFIMIFIGKLRKRRAFVLSFFKDFEILIEDKTRRIAHVDRINKRLIQGYSRSFPNIIIQRNRNGRFYETIKIKYRGLLLESDIKEVLSEFLIALRGNPSGNCYIKARKIRFKRVKKKHNRLYSPYLRLYASGRFSPKLCEAIKKAIEYDF